jgi:Arc/MetJ family transcription regulator
MFQLTIEVDELTLQEAAAALDTTTAAETVLRALTVATEVGRGRRLADRQRRLGRADASRRRRR